VIFSTLPHTSLHFSPLRWYYYKSFLKIVQEEIENFLKNSEKLIKYFFKKRKFLVFCDNHFHKNPIYYSYLQFFKRLEAQLWNSKPQLSHRRTRIKADKLSSRCLSFHKKTLLLSKNDNKSVFCRNLYIFQLQFRISTCGRRRMRVLEILFFDCFSII